MNKLPNHTALKEWASVIDALGRGEQVVLIRKGGLADPHFGLEADRFYLFPTNYHDGSDARLHITHWAQVVRTWKLTELETLHRLEPHIILDRETLDTRFKFRADQAINVIAVRAFRLARPAAIEAKSEYDGCRSWVSIDEEIDVDGSTPALSERELQARIERIDALLAAAV
jgi:hypothetical protein